MIFFNKLPKKSQITICHKLVNYSDCFYKILYLNLYFL